MASLIGSNERWLFFGRRKNTNSYDDPPRERRRRTKGRSRSEETADSDKGVGVEVVGEVADEGTKRWYKVPNLLVRSRS